MFVPNTLKFYFNFEPVLAPVTWGIELVFWRTLISIVAIVSIFSYLPDILPNYVPSLQITNIDKFNHFRCIITKIGRIIDRLLVISTNWYGLPSDSIHWFSILQVTLLFLCQYIFISNQNANTILVLYRRYLLKY